MKYAKRSLAMVLVIITIVAMMALPAAAAEANTTDSTATVTVTASFLKNRPYRQKNNTSAVYLLINSSANYVHTYVQAQGCSSDGKIRTNYTMVEGEIVTNVVCRRNVKYSIHTAIYENGYRYASLDFKHLNGNTSATSLNYTWSPDSTREYAYAA